MEWKTSLSPVPYEEAVASMEARIEAISHGTADELAWLLEHPPLYTSGTSARADDLLEARFPVYKAGRGGEYTYHGPGQRIAYMMLDLKRLFAPGPPDLRTYVHRLEQWMIGALRDFGIEGFVREGRIGVWVNGPGGEAKIAAIGVRVRKWISFHGIALNVSTDLSHYAGIVPCGIRDAGVTSMQAMGVNAPMDEVDAALKSSWKNNVK